MLQLNSKTVWFRNLFRTVYFLPVVTSLVITGLIFSLLFSNTVGLVNQPLQVTNSDMTTHNIHPVPKDNREWNQSQPPGAAPLMETFAREEVAIPVKCNVHPWMRSYICVVGHPFYAVTGDDGSFTIKGLPPGDYTIEAWHEKYGKQETKVTVGPKESKAADFTFKG